MTPVLLIDSREKTPLRFTRYPSEVATLVTGDYALKGFPSTAWTIERKTTQDLVLSLSAERARFIREVDRLLACEFRRLLVIGAESDIHVGAYQSRMTPQAVIASLAAIEARGLPVVFCRTPAMAAETVERWAGYFVREKSKPFLTDAQLKEITAPLWATPHLNQSAHP